MRAQAERSRPDGAVMRCVCLKQTQAFPHGGGQKTAVHGQHYKRAVPLLTETPGVNQHVRGFYCAGVRGSRGTITEGVMVSNFAVI